eukprot:189857-Prymnesium_polylepis.1
MQQPRHLRGLAGAAGSDALGALLGFTVDEREGERGLQEREQRDEAADVLRGAARPEASSGRGHSAGWQAA